ncbi:hypothetical protein QEN19_002752 [Hanseniaspora menglaensis]
MVSFKNNKITSFLKRKSSEKQNTKTKRSLEDVESEEEIDEMKLEGMIDVNDSENEDAEEEEEAESEGEEAVENFKDIDEEEEQAEEEKVSGSDIADNASGTDVSSVNEEDELNSEDYEESGSDVSSFGDEDVNTPATSIGDTSNVESGITKTIYSDGTLRLIKPEIDPVYESDDSDFFQPKNTIGNIPIEVYDEMPHIGYDINGKRIMRPVKGKDGTSAIDRLLESIDLPAGWTGLVDKDTGGSLNLSNEELELIKKVEMASRGEVMNEEDNEYPEYVDWFSRHLE